MLDKALSRGFGRRAFLAGLGATAGISVLAACQPQVVEKIVRETVVVEKIVEKEVIVEKEKIVEVPQEMERTTIRMSHWWGETFKKSLLLEAARWMPELIIQEETTPWSEYHTKLLTQLAAGTSPDAFLQDSTFNGMFFKVGAELALNDYLKASELNPDGWWFPLETNVGYKGQIYGLPQFADEQIVVSFNMDILGKSNIKLPVPGTDEFDTWKWDKWAELLVDQTKRSSSGKVEQWGLDANFSGFYWKHQMVLSQTGAVMFDDPNHFDETEIFCNNEDNMRGIQDMADIHIKHKVTPNAAETQAIEGGPFKAGKAVARVYQGMACCNKDFPFPFQSIAIPYTKVRGQILGGNHWSLAPRSKVLDGAWKWIKFSTTNKKAIIDSNWALWHTIPHYEAKFHLDLMPEGDIKQAYEAWLFRDIEYRIPRWLGGKIPEKVQEVLKAENEAVNLEKKTVKEAMTSAKTTIDPLLR